MVPRMTRMKKLTVAPKFFPVEISLGIVSVGLLWSFVTRQNNEPKRAYKEYLATFTVGSMMMIHSEAEEYAASKHFRFILNNRAVNIGGMTPPANAVHHVMTKSSLAVVQRV